MVVFSPHLFREKLDFHLLNAGTPFIFGLSRLKMSLISDARDFNQQILFQPVPSQSLGHTARYIYTISIGLYPIRTCSLLGPKCHILSNDQSISSDFMNDILWDLHLSSVLWFIALYTPPNLPPNLSVYEKRDKCSLLYTFLGKSAAHHPHPFTPYKPTDTAEDSWSISL
jgi:hypothetical protein